MLIELNIRNIALIESLRIEFTRGLNVLTGETGAGKSIVVDCVNLALGGRADRGRPGDRAAQWMSRQASPVCCNSAWVTPPRTTSLSRPRL